MTTLTPERLAELDALPPKITCGKCKGGWVHCYTIPSYECGACGGKGELVDPLYASLSAALRAAWAERDQWRTYAHDVEGVRECIAEILTGESDTAGLVHRAQEIRAERDRLATRLAEAEELLRPFSEWYAKWGEEIATEAKSAYRAAAAFLARTEATK